MSFLGEIKWCQVFQVAASCCAGFIHERLITAGPRSFAQSIGVERAESKAPAADGFVGNADSSFR